MFWTLIVLTIPFPRLPICLQSSIPHAPGSMLVLLNFLPICFCLLLPLLVCLVELTNRIQEMLLFVIGLVYTSPVSKRKITKADQNCNQL